MWICKDKTNSGRIEMGEALQWGKVCNGFSAPLQIFRGEGLQYNTPLPNVTWHSGTWSYTATPSVESLIRHCTKSWRYYRTGPSITVFDVITSTLFWEVFIGHFAMGAASQQTTLTPPDTWSCPIWDLYLFLCWVHSFLMLITPTLSPTPPPPRPANESRGSR